MLKSKKGFTLIELVLVIVILGILAVVAIPRFVDLASQARSAAEQGVVGGVRAAIAVAHTSAITGTNNTHFNNVAFTANNYPGNLDNSGATGSANNTNPFFNKVLSSGVTDSRWTKTAANTYQYNGANNYAYNNNDGSFEQL